jgi:haloalkane dehalogenase
MSEGLFEKMAFASKFVDVNGAKIHYLDQGSGDAILFLHGIPTSCYVWRNILPYLGNLGHCLAPDLPGFGHSDSPDIEYSIADYVNFLQQFIEKLNLKNITLVMHGFGTVIGLDYAMRHPENCKGLVFYEAFLNSLEGEYISLPFQEQVMEVENSPGIMSNGAALIDLIIPQQVLNQLTEVEMDCYRQPFLNARTSKPILQYFSALTNKNALHKFVSGYSKKLSESQLPKLMLFSVPGFITTISTVIWAKENLPNLEIIDIGEELHLGQESNPEIMGEAISAWLQGIAEKV